MTTPKILPTVAVSAVVSSALTAGLLAVLPATAAINPGPRPSIESVYSREAKIAASVEKIAVDVKALKLRGEESARILKRLNERNGDTRVTFGRSPYELLVTLYSACVANEDCPPAR